MEIKTNNKIYAINPHRVIAIEKWDYGNARQVIVHMTDDFNICFFDEDDSEYERLRDELRYNVCG